MKLLNSFYKYGLLAKMFHWITFLLLLLQFPLGLYLVSLEFSETRINLEAIHIYLGILIFYITAFRLIWKIVDPKPSPKKNLFRGQVLLSKINYFFMYFSLLAITVSGMLKKLFMGENLNFIFFKLKFIESNFELSDLFYTIHIYANYLLVLLFIVHILAVIVHHYIYKENILSKML